MGQMSKVRGRATSITRRAGKTFVRYHSTDVVVFDDRAVTLDSGGWKTATTKARMNQASHEFGLGFSVYQDKGEWFVMDRSSRKSIPFVDGMTLDCVGEAAEAYWDRRGPGTDNVAPEDVL